MGRRLRRIGLAAMLAAAIAATAGVHAEDHASVETVIVPPWAFPGSPPAPANAPLTDDVTLLHVPGSRMVFTRAQVTDLFSAPDWFPDSHPPMPDVVARGRKPDVYACGYCHLPDGKGRPENASLAGLPAGYIVAQVADFRSGARRSAWHGPHRPNELMRATAQGATDDEVAAAAEYFSKMPMTRHVELIEATRVPQTREVGWLYVATGGAGTEPLGLRIIEMPLDHERHELRDPTSLFRAYVPRGSVSRGRHVAQTGLDGPASACAACHGTDLRGVGLIPPLAGRSPTYILRQLLAFRTGARASVAGQPMLPVVAQLSVEDMVAVAAYAASREP